MVRRAALVLPLLLATAACAAGPSLPERLAPLRGQSEGDLVAALGVPTRTYEADGRRFLQYEERRLVLYPGTDPFLYGPYYPYWRYRPLTTAPTAVVTGCDVTFELRGGAVADFAVRGRGCG